MSNLNPSIYDVPTCNSTVVSFVHFLGFVLIFECLSFLDLKKYLP